MVDQLVSGITTDGQSKNRTVNSRGFNVLDLLLYNMANRLVAKAEQFLKLLKLVRA